MAKPTPSDGPIGLNSTLLADQVHAADAHDAPVLHRVLDGEQAGEEAGIVVDVVDGAEAHAAQPLLERTAERPGIDLGEVLGLDDQDVVAEEVQQLAVGREPDVDVLALFAARPGNRARDLLLLQVVELRARRR